MPLIVTPWQLSQRAEFYHQLSQLTMAGIGLPQALEQMQRNPPALSFRAPIRRLLKHLNEGCPFTDAMRLVGGWMPAYDLALLQAGEQSGRLPECFRQISEQYRDRAQLIRVTLLALAYPLCILHFAILIFPLNRLTGLVLRGEILAFILQKLLVVVPLYTIVAVAVIAGQGKAAGWRSLLELLLHPVPVLGRARRCLAIARLSSALEALINAGVNIIEAWELAAAASASPALMRVVRVSKSDLEGGLTPAEMIASHRAFPSEFAQMYSAGEVSGKLDESLRRARDYFQDEGARKLKAFVFVCTGILIFTIMLVVAWQIISFYIGYFQQTFQAVEGF